jgi:hypothetical protein
MRKPSIPARFSRTVIILGVLPAVAFTAISLGAQTPGSPGASAKSARSAAVELKPDKKAAKPTVRTNGPLLPADFAGWQAATSALPVTDPAQIDAANTAALKEFGFSDALLNDYTRGSEALKIKALRFGDASGAYGAYSFYRQTGWPKVEIGTGGASNNNRVLFWVGNVVVDAQFSRISAMSGSELRELASTIPVPNGNKSLAPPILANLPQKDMDGQSTHYALGPASYAGPAGSANPGTVLPPSLIGFERGAETATASYKLESGPATLTLINYPTPQMAAAQARRIDEYLKAGNNAQHPFTKPLQDSNPAALEVRRSGPLVAVVSGDPIPDDAHKLLETVHYEADMSSLPGGPNHEVQNFAKLILGIVVLVIVMFAAAVVVAIFLGGGRAAFRVMRGKPASTMFDDEFTRLDLRE